MKDCLEGHLSSVMPYVEALKLKGATNTTFAFLRGSGWILKTIKYFNPDIQQVTLHNVIQNLRILKSSVR